MRRCLPLQVDCSQTSEPCRIKYKNRPLQVTKLLECWQDTGCWWAGESEKIFYRLVLEDKSIREIYYDLDQREWYLYKTYD